MDFSTVLSGRVDPDAAPDLPGTLVNLSTRALPSHPGGPDQTTSLVVHPVGGRLRHLRKIGRPQFGVTRPNRVHLR